ncbi:MAG: hypothetical protein HOD16_02225 [Nitrospina sp.]|nr:hypothetical protein [Nitrospina sp.]
MKFIANRMKGHMPEPSRGVLAHPVLGYGFRLFFLLGALYSIFSLLTWGEFYAGLVTPSLFMVYPVSWHAHEMIYGYTMAIVAGFLLTAVRTGQIVPPCTGISFARAGHTLASRARSYEF